jgi:hypothetical protein
MPHAKDSSQMPRETVVNTDSVSRSLAVATALLAEQHGPLEMVGFLKNGYSFCDNCSEGLVNRTAGDRRGALSPPVPW